MTDRERLLHYCGLAGRMIGSGTNLADHLAEARRDALAHGCESTARTMQAAIDRWQAAVEAWDARHEEMGT